jgi:Ni/Co efflux regulator RcnB
MKKRFLVLSAALLLLPDIAQAQQQPGGPGGDRQGRPGAGQGRPERPGGGGPGGPGRPGGGGPGQPGRPGGPGGPAIQPPRPGGPGGPAIQPPRPSRPQPPVRPQPGRPGAGHRPPSYHRPGAGRPPNFRPIRGPAFRYPRGYAYRRWTIGLLLPSLFLSSTYYYNNYAALGVGPPAPGYRWVRYGPDLLMVDQRTGRIGDVIYGAFD